MKPIYLLQDNARETNEEDHLGMKAWVDVIAGTAVGNDGPFTIGIYKEWGYGKTTLLRLAKEAVAEYAEKESEPTVTVWFNAWQFEREEHPLFALIAAITDAIEKAVKDEKGGGPSRLKKIGISLRALTRGMKFKGEVGVPLLGQVGVEFDAEKALKAEEVVGKQTNPLQAESLYHSAFELLGESAKGEDEDEEKAKIVVFIDDLDRCNPENAVRLLENIKLVLAQKGFVFVLAVDHVVIETYLDKVYEEKYGFKPGTDRGRKYLEKIVQLPLEIPPHEKRFTAYVEKLIKELARMYKGKDPRIAALRTVQGVLADHVGHNPRRLVRLIDSFIIDTFLWDGTADLRKGSKYELLTDDVANGIAIHRVVLNALGEHWTSALISDIELRTRIAEHTLDEREYASPDPTTTLEDKDTRTPELRRRDAEENAGRVWSEPTPHEKLVQRLLQVPDLLHLLQLKVAKALVVPGKGEEDLWSAVRHFMTTTRVETSIEFADFLDKAIRTQLKLDSGDPIPVSRLSEVQELDFRFATDLTDVGLVHLSRLPGLQKVYFRGLGVTNAGLAHLSGLSVLQRLFLEGTGVTDAGLAHLSGLSGLQWLDLEGTGVTDAGLAHLSGLSGLQWLDLRGTDVMGAGLAHLSGLAGLQELHISRTGVTDAGLAHLKGLAGLQTLQLNDTQVTDAGVAELKKALPKCEIRGP